MRNRAELVAHGARVVEDPQEVDGAVGSGLEHIALGADGVADLSLGGATVDVFEAEVAAGGGVIELREVGRDADNDAGEGTAPQHHQSKLHVAALAGGAGKVQRQAVVALAQAEGHAGHLVQARRRRHDGNQVVGAAHGVDVVPGGEGLNDGQGEVAAEPRFQGGELGLGGRGRSAAQGEGKDPALGIKGRAADGHAVSDDGPDVGGCEVGGEGQQDVGFVVGEESGRDGIGA